jgi:hypothetical protein
MVRHGRKIQYYNLPPLSRIITQCYWPQRIPELSRMPIAQELSTANAQQGLIVVRLHHSVQQQQQRVMDRCIFRDSSLLPLVCLVTMPAASSFDRLFGVDAPIGYVWLDTAAPPTLSSRLLHALVVSSGLIEESWAKSTCGHWRMRRRSVNLIRHSTTGNPLWNSLFI